jgi:hypothetical protein
MIPTEPPKSLPQEQESREVATPSEPPEPPTALPHEQESREDVTPPTSSPQEQENQEVMTLPEPPTSLLKESETTTPPITIITKNPSPSPTREESQDTTARPVANNEPETIPTPAKIPEDTDPNSIDHNRQIIENGQENRLKPI